MFDQNISNTKRILEYLTRIFPTLLEWPDIASVPCVVPGRLTPHTESHLALQSPLRALGAQTSPGTTTLHSQYRQSSIYICIFRSSKARSVEQLDVPCVPLNIYWFNKTDCLLIKHPQRVAVCNTASGLKPQTVTTNQWHHRQGEIIKWQHVWPSWCARSDDICLSREDH